MDGKRRFVILDRDGTLIVEKRCLSDPNEVELLPYAAWGLRMLKELRLGLIIVTNQPDISRGLISIADLTKVHSRLSSLLHYEKVHLDFIYYCPHTAYDRCRCRKPATLLLEHAASKFDFDLRTSFVIGDRISDIEMGQRVGATTMLVRSEQKLRDLRPDYTVDNLVDAAEIVREVLQWGV